MPCILNQHKVVSIENHHNSFNQTHKKCFNGLSAVYFNYCLTFAVCFINLTLMKQLRNNERKQGRVCQLHWKEHYLSGISHLFLEFSFCTSFDSHWEQKTRKRMPKQVKRMRKGEKMDANFTKAPLRPIEEIMASSGGLRAQWHMALTRYAERTHTDASAHNVSVRGTSPQGSGETLHTRQRLWAKDGRSSVMKSNQYCASDSVITHRERRGYVCSSNSTRLCCPRLKVSLQKKKKEKKENKYCICLRFSKQAKITVESERCLIIVN